jgi:ABC-type uncharacterized transport system substrate-binding protein
LPSRFTAPSEQNRRQSESAYYRRTTIYVDKILKGRKPADLPVEQPTKFEFIINMNVAKQISVTSAQRAGTGSQSDPMTGR